MRIDEDLAVAIARSALTEPYRQIDVMNTRRFVDWLKARGIDVGDWRMLHHLWAIGVLHPIAVLGDAPSATPSLVDADHRFIKIDLELRGPSFVDIGTVVPKDAPLLPQHKYPGRLQETLLWHPFQLWQFDHLERWVIRVPFDWSGSLVDSSASQDPSFAWRLRRDWLMKFATEERQRSFLRLLALLLRVEPYVHTMIDRMTRLPASDDGRQYFAWLDDQACTAALDDVGLTLEAAERWHEDLSFSAQCVDPLESFRKLMRHAARSHRNRLKGAALLAHDLYDHAEVLRRYLERYHGRELSEEDDVGSGPEVARINEENYGSPRPGDFDRKVFRRITRHFGVDPQAQTVYFVEGCTEEGFIEHWADMLGIELHSSGVQVVNLEGKDGVRNALFSAMLYRLQDDEIFPVVALDEDRHGRAGATWDHIEKLRELRKSGLLPVQHRIWRPNFVARNFTVGELVRIARSEAGRRGLTLSLTAKEIVAAMHHHNANVNQAKDIWTIEDALIKLTNRRAKTRLLEKGKPWGALLADWAIRVPPPKAIQDRRGRRPILALCEILVNAQGSDYALTVEMSGGRRSRKHMRARKA